MFGCEASARTAVETLARSIDRSALSGEEALALVRNLGVVRKLADALAGQAALRVEEIGMHRRWGDRTVAVTVAKAFGIEPVEAQRIVETAARCAGRRRRRLRCGRVHCRCGRPSWSPTRRRWRPGSERRMLSAARQGLRCLKDEAARVRAEVEDPAARAARQRRDRSLSWWTDADGMVNGRLRLPAEIGGPIVGWFDEATRRVFRERSRLEPERHESHAAYAEHAAYAADVSVELVRRNAWPTKRDNSVGVCRGFG